MDSSIGRLLGSEANRSHLRALPAFKVEQELPPDLMDLLGKLDRAEAQRSQQRR